MILGQDPDVLGTLLCLVLQQDTRGIRQEDFLRIQIQLWPKLGGIAVKLGEEVELGTVHVLEGGSCS